MDKEWNTFWTQLEHRRLKQQFEMYRSVIDMLQDSIYNIHPFTLTTCWWVFKIVDRMSKKLSYKIFFEHWAHFCFSREIIYTWNSKNGKEFVHFFQCDYLASTMLSASFKCIYRFIFYSYLVLPSTKALFRTFSTTRHVGQVHIDWINHSSIGYSSNASTFNWVWWSYTRYFA